MLSNVEVSKIQNGWGFSIAFVAAAAVVQAQQPAKLFRIGFLDSSTASGMAGLLEAFQQEMNKLGWVEGKNIAFEYRFAEGKNDRCSRRRSLSSSLT